MPYFLGQCPVADSRWFRFLQSPLLNHEARRWLLRNGVDPASPQTLKSVEVDPESPAKTAVLDDLFQELQHPGAITAPTPDPLVRLCSLGEPDYPPLLAELADAPPALFCRGQLSSLSRPGIAIVGTRHPSIAGTRIARTLAAELVQAGFCVVSGLAQGIDTAAHQGAVDAGGPTVAIMATGYDRVYPRRNQRLAGDIQRRGLLMTEFCAGAAPHRWHFPRRNRTLSGLALATVVVEAGRPSGTLITAAAAGEQGRTVFAFPWSVQHPRGQGCLHLLKQGATLVTSARDVVEQLSSSLRAWYELTSFPPLDEAEGGGVCPEEPGTTVLLPEHKGLTRDAQDLLVAIGDSALDIASLCRARGMELPHMMILLTQLEVAGHVEQTAQGFWRARGAGT